MEAGLDQVEGGLPRLHQLGLHPVLGVRVEQGHVLPHVTRDTLHVTRETRGGTCLARNSRICGLSLSAQRLFPMGERSSLALPLHWVTNTLTLAMVRTLCCTHTMTMFLPATVFISHYL